MKKLALILALVMMFAFVLTGCNGDNDTDVGTQETPNNDLPGIIDDPYYPNGGWDIPIDDPFYPNGDWEWTPPVDADPDMAAYVEQIVADSVEIPTLPPTALTADNFESHLFIPYIEGSRSAVSQAAMSPHPHMVVLLELPEGTDASAVAAEIYANADQDRWICVAADVLRVEAAGRHVILIMTASNLDINYDAIQANFNSVFG